MTPLLTAAQLAALRRSVIEELALTLRADSRQLAAAVGAAAAYVATGGGLERQVDRGSVARLFVSGGALDELQLDDLLGEFDRATRLLTADRKAARREIVGRIAPFAGERSAARLIARTALAVAGADGALTPAETRAFNLQCRALGIAPGELMREAAGLA